MLTRAKRDFLCDANPPKGIQISGLKYWDSWLSTFLVVIITYHPAHQSVAGSTPGPRSWTPESRTGSTVPRLQVPASILTRWPAAASSSCAQDVRGATSRSNSWSRRRPLPPTSSCYRGTTTEAEPQDQVELREGLSCWIVLKKKKWQKKKIRSEWRASRLTSTNHSSIQQSISWVHSTANTV